ncbi:MAG: hypothetical protein KGS72_06825 [Cyanobacteria bacterium REEB67]|nr:hypothetical protein [Cyanobacteria bacterium REEB67]
MQSLLIEALESAWADGLLQGVANIEAASAAVRLSRPRLSAHGDLACSVGRIVSALGGGPSAEVLAPLLVARLKTLAAGRTGLDCGVFFSAPAFIGFRVSAVMAACSLSAIISCGKGAHVLAGAAATHAEERLLDRAALVKADNFLRLAISERLNILNASIEEPLLSPRQWLSLLAEWQSDSALFESLFAEEAASRASALDIVLHLGDLMASQSLSVGPMVASEPPGHNAAGVEVIADRGGNVLACALDRFFDHFEGDQGFFNCDLSVLKARLGLIFACRQVLSERLGIIDLSIPGLT